MRSARRARLLSSAFGDAVDTSLAEGIPMSFSFIQSLVRHSLKHVGNALGGGIVPIGSIASGIFDDWHSSGKPEEDGQNGRLHAELERMVQNVQAYRAQVDRLLAGQPEALQQRART